VAVLAAPASVVVLCASLALHGGIGRRAFVRHERAGRHGRRFALLKLRTNEGDTMPDTFAARLGHLLQRSGIDELPQLWNVLCGQMSLVGPRPLTTEFVPRYSPSERVRLAVRPGLTGWAQVRARHATTWPQSFAYDVWYARSATWQLDAKILLITCSGWRRRIRHGDPHVSKPDLVRP